MIKQFLKKLNEQSQDVFGVGAKKSLSIYSIFAVSAVIIPLASIVFILILKVF